MRWTYFCPHCDAGLNPDETIILVAEHDKLRSLIGLHPQPGNYQAYFPPGSVWLWPRMLNVATTMLDPEVARRRTGTGEVA